MINNVFDRVMANQIDAQSPRHIPTLTWAQVQALTPAAYVGAMVFCPDISQRGDVLICTGTRWKVIGGNLANSSTGESTVSTSSTTEMFADRSPLIRAGSFKVGDEIKLWVSQGKAGTTNATSTFWHFGTAGSIADQTIYTNTSFPTGTSRSTGICLHLLRISNSGGNSQVRFRGSGSTTDPFGGATTTALSNPITLNFNMDSADWYATLGFAVTTSETATLRDFMTEIIHRGA